MQLARGLAGAPRAVMMDEPFGALDTQTRATMQRLLVETWRTHPTTVVFVTHDVDEAVLLGDRVAVLGHAGAPLRTIVDVPRPRDRDALDRPDTRAARTKVLAALGHPSDGPGALGLNAPSDALASPAPAKRDRGRPPGSRNKKPDGDWIRFSRSGASAGNFRNFYRFFGRRR